MMSRFVVILAVALTAAATDTVNFEKCETVLKSHGQCCKKNVIIDASKLELGIKECLLMPDVPGSCEKSLCFGIKLGFVTGEESMKNNEWQKKLEEKLSDYKDILEHLKKQCFDDRYKTFGEPDECDADKITGCVIWQYIFSCPEFSNEDSCTEMKDIAPKCLELHS